FGAAFGRVAVHGDGDFVDQGAQQLLAVLIGGGRRVPHLAQVLTKGKDRGPLRAGEGGGACLFAAGQLGFGVGPGLPGTFPFGFQAARHEPVFGVDGPVPGAPFAGRMLPASRRWMSWRVSQSMNPSWWPGMSTSHWSAGRSRRRVRSRPCSSTYRSGRVRPYT